MELVQKKVTEHLGIPLNTIEYFLCRTKETLKLYPTNRLVGNTLIKTIFTKKNLKKILFPFHIIIIIMYISVLLLVPFLFVASI